MYVLRAIDVRCILKFIGLYVPTKYNMHKAHLYELNNFAIYVIVTLYQTKTNVRVKRARRSKIDRFYVTITLQAGFHKLRVHTHLCASEYYDLRYRTVISREG